MLAFVACIYFSAGKRDTLLHRTFTYLLITVLVHLIFDSVTVYTVNMLDTVPRLLNDTLHRLFVGTMVLVLYLFYQYIAILVEEETEKSRHLDMAFVIVSGYDDFSYCQEALRLQITDYIRKPVDYEEFGTCIDNLKIAMFRYESSKDMSGQEERTITGIIRYLQEHQNSIHSPCSGELSPPLLEYLQLNQQSYRSFKI